MNLESQRKPMGRVTLAYFWNQQLPIVSEWIDGITNRIAK